VICLFTAGAGAPVSSAAVLPATFWGVVPQATPTAEQFQRLKRGGVGSIRIPIGWGSVQPTEYGGYDWSGIDKLVGGAAKAGIEVLPFLYGAPTWAVPSEVVNPPSTTAPRNLPVKGEEARAWSSFNRQAVLRYGPGGGFWAENPQLPLRPIRTWQIWNEENFKYFVARPNPTEYGSLVKLSYTAIKGIDPGAQLILGGMFALPKEARRKTGRPTAYSARDFLDKLYRSTPGIKGRFAGVALHPYTSEYWALTPEIEEVRAVLRAHGDGRKGLWITELGWSSDRPNGGDQFAKGPGGQARELTGAFRLIERNQALWKIKRVYWFSVDDQTGVCNFCDGSGLFGPGFSPKPAWRAYVKFAGGKP
jgi:hypothetical protein